MTDDERHRRWLTQMRATVAAYVTVMGLVIAHGWVVIADSPTPVWLWIVLVLIAALFWYNVTSSIWAHRKSKVATLRRDEW